MNRREIILEAAKQAFIEKGYHKTTMLDISTKLNIKRTTLYDYFKSKEDIVFALIENMFEYNPLISTQGSLIERLEDICHQMLQRTKNNIELYRILFLALPVLDDHAKHKITSWQLPLIVEIDDILSSSVIEIDKQHDIKKLVFALISQTMSDYITKADPLDVNNDCRYIMKIVRKIV